MIRTKTSPINGADLVDSLIPKFDASRRPFGRDARKTWRLDMEIKTRMAEDDLDAIRS
jgi:hypothetical protein